MRTILVLAIAVLLASTVIPVKAQEQSVQVQCLEKEEVERLLAERDGLTWRYVDLLPSEILNGCVIRVNHRLLLINDKAYQWLGTKERGHWYKLVSVKEEHGQVWKNLVTDPREPTWIRVIIESRGEQVSTLRFSKPIRLIRVVGVPESEEVLRRLNQLYNGALEGQGTILLRPTCRERFKIPPNCKGFVPTVGGALAMLRFEAFYFDVMEDDFPNLFALLAQR